MQYTSTNFKRNGAQYLVDNITQAMVVVDTQKADTFAAHAASAIATVALTGADVNISNSGDDLLVTVNGRSNIDPSGVAAANQDIGIAYCSATEVIMVVDATDRIITNDTGDTIDIPAGQHFIRESTSI